MKKFEKLYKLDSKGKVREWQISVDGEGSFIVEHGLYGGKLQTKSTLCKQKNVGKSNETTIIEQAELEAQAKWVKQIEREDYATSPEESNKQIRPMLAMDYTKVPHRLDWSSVISQPKLDGVRLLSGKRRADSDTFEMMTRKGETYNVKHLEQPSIKLLEIINAKCDNRCLALDGELYIHGLKLQKIVSYSKKYKQGMTEQLEYHLFDLVIPDMSFFDRWRLLDESLHELIIGYYFTEHIFSVKTIGMVKEEHLDEIHGEYVEAGYEGVILRHSYSQYKIGGRSADLFKYKKFFDMECKITGVWLDKNDNAMLNCEMKNGNTFKCTPKRSHNERQDMWEDRENLVGKWITVKYQDFTEDGIPQFPVGLDLRECNEDGEPLI